MKQIISALGQALHNIRSHFFHTFLSILGIVIGVAALVAILSLIDGMEQFANDQINDTTSLKTIAIETRPFKMVDNVRVAKDTFAVLQYDDFKKLLTDVPGEASGFMLTSETSMVQLAATGPSVGAFIRSMTPLAEKAALRTGTFFTPAQVDARAQVAVINEALAKQLGQTPEQLLNKELIFKNLNFKIIGVVKEKQATAGEVMIPISLKTAAELRADPPRVYLDAPAVEAVAALKKSIENWLQQHYPTLHEDFTVQSNEFRVQQVAQGFVLFRVVMGLIVGISILVGGIGVMNVLLISVTERTTEIGIRKAMGASKGDILRLFLFESITISLLGSLLGLFLGVLFTLVAVPIVKAFIDVPFQAAYTLNTFLIISTIAVLIGIIFGTYPAMKAARLDPVEAMRRE